MKFFLVAVFTISMLALASSAMAVGTLQDGMTELAQQIVKNSAAKGKKSIAISSFQHINGDQSELSNYLADELVLKLFSVPNTNLEIIERGQLNKIFQEMQLNMTGVVDSKTIQELGKLHGVGALVLGSITEMGESIRVNARLIDTATGRVFSAAGTTISKTATIAELLSRIILVAEQGGSKKSFNSTSGVISKKSNTKGKPQIYELDLKKYDLGDMPEELGMATVELGKGITGKRILKGFQKSGLDMNLPFPLKGEFDISFTGYALRDTSILLSDGKGNTAGWKFNTYAAEVTIDKTRYGLHGKTKIPDIGKPPLTITLLGKGRIIKLLIDGKFVAAKAHDSSTEYTRLKITLPDQRSEIADISFVQQ